MTDRGKTSSGRVRLTEYPAASNNQPVGQIRIHHCDRHPHQTQGADMGNVGADSRR